MMFIALLLWHTIARVHPVHEMNADSVPSGHLPTNQINHLLLLKPKADIHFTVPQKIEG